jgi:hypothetical protein
MIDLTKLLAQAEFHIKRGDSMVMDPEVVKQLIGDMIEGEDLPPVQTDRDFEAEQVEAAKALQTIEQFGAQAYVKMQDKLTAQKPHCYMNDDYEIGLFTKQPDNPAYADFFAVYKDPQPAPGVQELVDVLSLTRSTVVRQLQLIEERAKGKFLDKRPVVDALRAHVKRIDTALAKHGGNDE